MKRTGARRKSSGSLGRLRRARRWGGDAAGQIEADGLVGDGWVEWGGELIWAVGFTESGAPFGLRVSDFDAADLEAMGLSSISGSRIDGPGGWLAEPDAGRGSDDAGAHVARRAVSLLGRWRIVEMELWAQEDVDLVGPGFIEFGSDGLGRFGFIAVQGSMDCREEPRDGRPGLGFTWEGSDDCDHASGRGWAVLDEDGSLSGRIYFHLGDDSGFRAERFEDGASTS